RMYLFIAALFLALSLAGTDSDNLFFVFYPCMLCGMIPVNLLAYDERSRWIPYCGTLPYTKAQIVSAKYLIGLSAQTAMLVTTGIAHGIKMHGNGNFVWNDFIMLMLMLLIVSVLSSSISLPFIFRLGVEKGRNAYYAMIGFVCAAGILASGLYQGKLQTRMQPNAVLIILAAVGIGVYILSWYLSVVFYKKRE
ncbi:MAG: ABC-2 transporter permease, partial [Eubacteriales bacterium]